MAPLTTVLHSLAEDAKKAEGRQKRAKAVKPVTLESELERLAKLKWKDDFPIFEKVRSALLAGELSHVSGAKLKKDDIYAWNRELERREREALKQRVRDSKPDNFIIVQDARTWTGIIRQLYEETEIALDTETTGLNFLTDKIVGISFYMPKADIAVYAPFAHRTGEVQLSEEQVLTPLREWLADPDNRVVFHNAKYDVHLLLNHNVKVANVWWDTMIAARLLNEHESHKLKELYDKYVAKSGEVVLFEDIIDNAQIALTDVVLAGVYAAGDAHKTWKLYEFQKPYIDTVGNLKTVWYEIESKLIPVDVCVERFGLRVDVDRLKQIEAESLPKIAKAKEEMCKSFNIDERFLAAMSERFGKPIEEFNFASNDHLAYLIYDVLQVGMDVPARFRKKERSTASDVINAIIEEIPELAPLKEYRELTKLVGTYAAKIPTALEVDGRLHAQFNSQGTATGRYSSSEYGNKGDRKGCNVQNIPGRTELGKEIRKCFLPDEGYLFISSDLSQIRLYSLLA